MQRRVKTEKGSHIIIRKYKGAYYPCQDAPFPFAHPSPSLIWLYTQKELEHAYKTGYLSEIVEDDDVRWLEEEIEKCIERDDQRRSKESSTGDYERCHDYITSVLKFKSKHETDQYYDQCERNS